MTKRKRPIIVPHRRGETLQETEFRHNMENLLNFLFYVNTIDNYINNIDKE